MGYLAYSSSQAIGPVIMNLYASGSGAKLKLWNMELNFLGPDSRLREAANKTHIIGDLQQELETALESNVIAADPNSDEYTKLFKNLIKTGQINLKMIKLPYQNISVTPRKENSKTSSASSQTPKQNDENVELIQFMQHEIELLKEQNDMLKSQLEAKPRSNKEYVLRKNSAPSVAESVNLVNSNNSNEVLNSFTNGGASIDPDNGSLYEILQEYMVENEDLRKQNDGLYKKQTNQASDLDTISRQNKLLNQKVNELTRIVTTIRRREEVTRSETPKISRKEERGYPIMVDDELAPKPNESSYLKQYDILRRQPQNINSRTPFSSKTDPIREKRIFETNENCGPKLDNGKRDYNETLLEELNRIESTIKNHIRRTQMNTTVRVMNSQLSHNGK